MSRSLQPRNAGSISGMLHAHRGKPMSTSWNLRRKRAVTLAIFVREISSTFSHFFGCRVPPNTIDTLTTLAVWNRYQRSLGPSIIPLIAHGRVHVHSHG